MGNFFKSDISSSSPQRMASSFRRLGWVGFWLQVFLGFIPILVLMIKVLSGQSRVNTSWGLFLVIACLLALLLAIYWCFQYVRLARKLRDVDNRPTRAAVMRSLWMGLTINIVGMICAVLIAMKLIGKLTLNMLRLPQGATVITPGIGGTSFYQNQLLTPSDMITVQATINVIAAELVGIIIALLLLRKMMKHSFHPTPVETEMPIH
jgi:hypothetical protein